MQILRIRTTMTTKSPTLKLLVKVLWIISTIFMASAMSSDPSSPSTTPGVVTVISDTISLHNLFNVSLAGLHILQRTNRLPRKKPIILPT